MSLTFLTDAENHELALRLLRAADDENKRHQREMSVRRQDARNRGLESSTILVTNLVAECINHLKYLGMALNDALCTILNQKKQILNNAQQEEAINELRLTLEPQRRRFLDELRQPLDRLCVGSFEQSALLKFGTELQHIENDLRIRLAEMARISKVEKPEATKRSTLLPGLLGEAIRAVPAVKYALGVAGLSVAAQIIIGVARDYRIAVFGPIAMLVLMFGLLIFAKLSTFRRSTFERLSLVVAWACIVIIIVSALLFMTSFFFGWPRALDDYWDKQIYPDASSRRTGLGSIEPNFTTPGDSTSGVSPEQQTKPGIAVQGLNYMGRKEAARPAMNGRKTLWISYAWADNANAEVDLVKAKLEPYLNVKIDRTALVPGQRLWEQIAKQISDDKESDAFGIVIGKASIQSQRVAEEIGYALERALSSRVGFPIIGLLEDGVDPAQLPPVLRIRLYVSLSSPDWVEQCVAGVNRRPPQINTSQPADVIIRYHPHAAGTMIELHPRVATISRMEIGLRTVDPGEVVFFGAAPPNSIPRFPEPLSRIATWPPRKSDDGTEWNVITWLGAISPAESLYALLKGQPRIINFSAQDQANVTFAEE